MNPKSKTRTGPGRGVLRLAAAAASLAAAAATGACDPCFGVTACEAPRVEVEGRTIFNNDGGSSFADVLVTFKRTGGVMLDRDSVAAVTDSTGAFVLRVGAREEGVVVGRLTFAPPPPYERYAYATEIELATIRASGERRYIGQWGVGPVIVRPRIHHVGELYLRGNGEPAEGVRVEFRQTGGPPLREPVITVTSGGDGRFYLEMETDPPATGEVVGELRITPDPPASPIFVPEVRLATLSVKDEIRFISRWGVGGQLRYQGELLWADTRLPAAGIEVEFRRTGGIAIDPATVTSRTGTDGRFHLDLRTRESGVLIGELHVRPPNPENWFVVPNVQLATHEDDESRLISVWLVR